VIHERARLGVLTSLMTHKKGSTFADFRQMCGLTDGNLSQHLKVLEEEKLVEIVEIVKAIDRNRPLTTCYVTSYGHNRYLEYSTTQEQVVRDAATVQATPTLRSQLRLVNG
jgi:DNA-binding transcriptional ArsR family regulator